MPTTDWQRVSDEALRRYPGIAAETTAPVDPATSRARSTAPWYVIRTATNRELAAEESLTDLGLVVYAPKLTRWRRHGRVKDKVQRPLIIGYLFARVADNDFPTVNESDGVSCIVGGDDPQPLGCRDERLLEKIRTKEAAGEFDQTVKATFRPAIGAKVKITGGQFAGVLAQVLELANDGRTRIRLSGLGGGTMRIDASQLGAT